jgi:hypothetical protein
MWEAILAELYVLSQYLAEGTEENHKNFSQASRSPGQNLNSGPLEYGARVGCYPVDLEVRQ